MLVLSRKLQEKIKIGDDITVTVLRVKGNVVRVGIEAPRAMRVIRAELPALGQSKAAEPETAEVPGAVEGPLVQVASELAAEEPAQAEASPPANAALLLPLRSMRKRRSAAPLRQVVTQCAALAK